MSVFTGRGLGCERGDRAVFSGLDFALGAGEALVLREGNGAGKTSLTAAENLRFWARLQGAGGGVPAALARFGLDRLADTPARFLSAGQRRRLALDPEGVAAVLGAVVDEEPHRRAGPGDAPDEEGQSVAFRDEGAYRRGCGVGVGAQPGDDTGERGDGARAGARERGAGVGRRQAIRGRASAKRTGTRTWTGRWR